MATRSMAKSDTVKSVLSQEVVFVKKVKKETKPLVNILTTEELEARGLTKNHSEGKWKKVIKASELDMLVTTTEDVREKWAVAPDGWYWKEFSQKCYYWLEWFELERIPEK